MMPPRLFGIRRVAVGNGMLLLFGGIAIAMWYFTSLYLQNVLGYSALRAGLGQTPAAVTFVAWPRATPPPPGDPGFRHAAFSPHRDFLRLWRSKSFHPG